MSEDNTLAIQMEQVFGISENWTVLNFFIDKARDAIKEYCNITEIPVSMNNSLVELGYHYYKNRHNTGVVQQSQGSRSASFNSADIPDSIKVRLPLPKLRLM